MSDVFNKLQDEELSGVSGGRGVITENPMGGYIYSDETGSVNISPKDWIWLRNQYNDPNPEEMSKDVTAKDIKAML